MLVQRQRNILIISTKDGLLTNYKKKHLSCKQSVIKFGLVNKVIVI